MTGVQTCALPILAGGVDEEHGEDAGHRPAPGPGRLGQVVHRPGLEELLPDPWPDPGQIGRASCRERV